MTFARARSLLAVVVCSVAGLAGCALPGSGRPGVAATYGDRVITSDDVDRVYLALDQLYSRPHPGEDLTLLLIGPGAVDIAEENGYTFTDDNLRADALMWRASQQGDQVEPTPAVLEVVQYVRAIAFNMNDADGLIAMVALVKDVASHTEASPRFGAFSFDAFGASIGEIGVFLDTNSTGLGPAVFLAYKDVDGFGAADLPDWISGE